jgi:predicted enzyme related to lactoylglutathione lyase
MPRIAYANVFVRDLERACAFYAEVLGLTLQRVDAAHGYASLDAGPIRLGLAKVEEAQAELAGRHTGLGFDVDDLEAEHARLVAAGVDFPMPPERQPWGGFMALMADPDGNVFYLDEISAAHG